MDGSSPFGFLQYPGAVGFITAHLFMTKHEMLAILRALAQHSSSSGYVIQQDFVRLVGLMEISIMQEVLAMPQDEESVYKKGYDLGTLWGATFELKKGSNSHFALGRYFATNAGYKSDADLYIAYINGFVEGLVSSRPKEIGEYTGS